MQTRMVGKWGKSINESEQTNFFEFSIFGSVKAEMKLEIGQDSEMQMFKHHVTVDLNEMRIDSAEGQEKLIDQFYAIDSVETAQLKYCILQPDVSFIMHEGQAKV